MKKIIGFVFIFLAFSAALHAEDGKEARKCINGYHIVKRYTQSSLKNNECKIIVSYYDGQMNKILRKAEVVHNEKSTRFSDTKTEIRELKLTPGKYKLQFKAESYIPITSDTLEFAKKEVIEIRVNLDSKDQPIECDKPVIYVYTPQEMAVYITLNLSGELGFTYPPYAEGWNIIATPEGTLTQNGQEYNYLFWEGTTHIERTQFLNQGFEVSTDHLIPFFEKQLTQMGLSTKEQQDFITYWVPRMNKYKAVRLHYVFNESFDAFAHMEVVPKPDHIFRVFMMWTGLNELRKSDITPQAIPTLKREGFHIIEWGGTEIQPESIQAD